MFKNISIIGDGGMGTVLGMLLCENREALSAKREASDERPATRHEVRMWGYDRRQLEQIEKGRENKKFLPGYKLPEELVFEANDERIMAGADLIVSAVPCQFMRGVWKRLKDYVPQGVPIVSVAKGIENDTLLRPTQILGEILDERRGTRDEGRETRDDEGREMRDEGREMRFAVLSGPTIADELARRLPATACAAADDEALAKEIQHTFSDGVPWLRVYTNTDIVGVELAGAMKNIIAIAAGIIDGTGAGDNAKAALLTRGLAEITRLGVTMGAREQTFAGLTGLGDLVTTCISPKGRNRSFGERVGKGQTAEQAQRATESVVEGVATCKSVVALGERYNVEMPITQAVYEVLFENKPVQTAIEDLMSRQLKAE
jgi:glycerol-3-phosphate dehydrogenase (NAD(P)+)